MRVVTQYHGSLPQAPSEVELENGFPSHYTDCSPKVNQGIRDHNAINVHKHYWATIIQVLWGDDPPKHYVKRLSKKMDSGVSILLLPGILKHSSLISLL